MNGNRILKQKEINTNSKINKKKKKVSNNYGTHFDENLLLLDDTRI